MISGSADPSGGIATTSFVTPEGSSGSGWRSRTQISHRPSGVIRPSAYRSRPPDSGGDRHRIGAHLLSVEPLIGEVGEERRAAVDQVGTPAVLVNGRPDVEPRRGDLDRLGERGRVHEHRSSALAGPAFPPVHGAVVEPRLRERDTADRHHLRADRRSPGAVRRHLAHAGRLATITLVSGMGPPLVLRMSRKPSRPSTRFTSADPIGTHLHQEPSVGREPRRRLSGRATDEAQPIAASVRQACAPAPIPGSLRGGP